MAWCIRMTDLQKLIEEAREHERIGLPGLDGIVPRLADALSDAHAALRQRDVRDDWIRTQLAGIEESADAVALTTGLALARAVASDVRDARAALEGTPDMTKEKR